MAGKSIYEEMAEVIRKNQQEILKTWVGQIIVESKRLVDALGEEEIKKFAMDYLDLMVRAMPSGDNIEAEPYKRLREILEKISADSAVKGINPSETAAFIFSAKEPVFSAFQSAYQQREKFAEAWGALNKLIDKLGFYTFETYVKSKEGIIKEQQRALFEVSVPVVKVWEKVFMIPLVGILDSARTQLVMEALLTAIEENQAKVAILDISGIPVVDSLVAKHIIRTVSAVKLMGAECIITGIRSRIAQTMIQLGVDLGGIVTRTTLADGLKVALDLIGQKITGR